MNTSQNKLKFRRLGLFTSIVLTAALFVGGSSVAQAESADGDKKSSVKYNRSSSKVKAKENLDTKFKKEQAKQKKADSRKVKMIAGTEFAKKREAVKQEIADQQIEQLKRLLKATDPTDPEYADLLFRLADHFLEKKAYFELQSGSLYEQIYVAEEKGQKKKAKQLKAKQKNFDKKAKEASGQAVKLYKALVSSPALSKYKRIDEALYFYAFELGQLGREAEMKDAYVKLIQDYPNSQYIPNAYLSFADYYFGKQQIGDALRLYEKVITFKDSPVYAYALYKMGWCHLNPVGTAEPRYDLSLQYFVNTVKATIEGRAGSEGNAKQLRRDARRDLVQAYAQVGKVSAAYSFFKKIGDGPKKDEDMSRKMMELLAVRYFGGGFYTESTYIYKQLQDTFPEDPDTCEWQGRIVINALASDNKDVQWKETDKLGEYWDKFRDGKYKKSIKRKCRDETLDTMKQMATVWHDEAEKTKNAETYKLAEKAYESFLRTFPKDKERYEIQLYYAELLWARASSLVEKKETKEEGLAKFRRAHEEFVKVLEVNPSGKYTQDAAYAQMLAMKNALEYDETGGQSKACKTNSEGVCVYKEKGKKKKVKKSKNAKVAATDYAETDYTDDEKAMLSAYEIYQKYVKKKGDKELPKIMYHRAKLMMIHNKFKEAKPLTEEIVVKFDGSIYAAWCAEMLLDILTINWTREGNTPEETLAASDELEKWAKKFQTLKVYKHEEAEELRKAIPRLLAGIGWKKGMAYLEAGRNGDPEGYRKCAEQFIAIYNEYGDEHDKADTLIWNAAQCYEASFLLGQAVRFRKILLQKFPESEHYKATLQYLGGNYQAIAMYAKAAERYEAYAEKYIKESDAPDALQNAYLYRLGLGQYEEAETNLRKYENLYKRKDPKKAATIFWSRHDILKTDEEILSHAKAYLKTYARTGGNDRQIVAEGVIGQILWRQSCEKGLLYDSCISIKRKTAVAGEKARQRAKALKRKARKAKKKKKGGGGSGKKKVDIPKYCGSATSGIITVYPRNKKRAAEAQKHLAAVIKLSKKKVDIPEGDRRRVEDFRNAVAMAQVYRADQDYEEYLTLEMPGGLNFNVEEWKKDSGLPKWEREYKEQVKIRDASVKKLTEWKTKKEGLGAKLVKAYDGVVAAKQSPNWMLAAAARSAMVSQNFADQLYRAEVPTQFKTDEEYFAYCDALADMAGPIQESAVQKFTYCLDRSTQFQFFNEFSRLCEDELQQRDPDKYPATNEMFGDSIYTDSRPDVVDVQLDLEGEKRKANLGGSKKKKPKDEEAGEESF